MDRLTIIANAAGHQQMHAAALAAGARRHGVKVDIASHERGAAPVVACWGWRIGEHLLAKGYNVLVMERGYLGDRFAWTSLGWNGLNGRAEFPMVDDGGARFRQHFGHMLADWRPGSAHVLLIQQVPGDMSLGGRDLKPWYRAQAKAYSAAYGLPVMFRPHPEAKRRRLGVVCPARASFIDGTLDEALAGAAVVVTYNSNVGVDAVMAGKPVVAVDAGSMVYDVAAHMAGEIRMPDRSGWATRTAWCQWTLDEITSGAAWDVVGKINPSEAHELAVA